MSEQRIFAFAAKLTDSMIALRDSGRTVQALMLTYIGIEQMAWLSVPHERANSADFTSWVRKYILPKNPMSVTAEELWEARNGLLHMGTTEHQTNQRDTTTRKVYYTFGSAECTKNDEPNVVFVNAEHLFRAYLTAVLLFMENLRGDPSKLQTALSKLDRMLDEQGLSAG